MGQLETKNKLSSSPTKSGISENSAVQKVESPTVKQSQNSSTTPDMMSTPSLSDPTAMKISMKTSFLILPSSKKDTTKSTLITLKLKSQRHSTKLFQTSRSVTNRRS